MNGVQSLRIMLKEYSNVWLFKGKEYFFYIEDESLKKPKTSIICFEAWEG